MRWRRNRAEQSGAKEAAPATAQALGFGAAEWQAIRALRARYQREHDPLTGQNMARLRFARWLVATGRLKP